MLQPKRVKFRKQHRGRRRGEASGGNEISFGEFGLQAVGHAWIDSRQIEAARRAITHELKRGGKVWIRIFPDKPVTAKPAETRMGSGKGAPDHWVAVVKPGRMHVRGRRREGRPGARSAAARGTQAAARDAHGREGARGHLMAGRKKKEQRRGAARAQRREAGERAATRPTAALFTVRLS